MDQKTLREILTYDCGTGIFLWKIKVSRKVNVGQVAGVTERHAGKEYRRISIYGRRYYAHHLAWLYVHGVLPRLVDHRDINGLNNAIGNLRLASHSENLANTLRQRNNKSGFKGVSLFKRDGTYSAEITVRGRKFFLGYFDTPQEAHVAYTTAAQVHYGEFGRAA